MNRIKLIKVLFQVVLNLPAVVVAQDLDKILTRHFEAVGQEQILSMRTISMDMREMNGFSKTKEYTVTKKAPSKIIIEGVWKEQRYVSAYDGVRAWTIAPWTGVQVAQLMTEREKALLLLDVGLGSPLYNYAGLDQELTLIGSEYAQDKSHYVIRVTRPSGFYVDYLLNKKTYMVHLVRIYKEDNVEEVEKEVIFKNYKKLGAFSMPFEFENRIDRSATHVIVDDIVFGQGAPSSLFKMPEN
ncbi:hypothetical protein N7E81_03050 [Reichenbachiella carrageenanivorans]|uniref:Outer membrane lipoprotein-sorting protein n=1 Tax=Reichenbachiella carrageenanivorans TaxID=2979869 RepID=A0ABY6D4U7_9BACT|nr:hypothetical protein [Reichenbachiella carrageenanivorans]UXX80083.1 hypothetical protein N7E81_03050 [Reichenbachiella carrageenanivorans]